MNRYTKKIILIVSIIALFLVGSHFALAGSIDVGLTYGDSIGLGTTDPVQMTLNIINIFLGLLGLVVVVLFIYAGFIWMTASGSADKVEKAKKIIKNAVIGLIIVLSAFGIVNWVVNALFDVTGVTCTDGQSRACGCGNAGTQLCSGGTWEACTGDCVIGQCCKNDKCQSCGDLVLSASIYPKGKWSVPLNGIGVVRFNRNIVPGSGSLVSKRADSMTDVGGVAVTFDSILKFDRNIEYNNQSTCGDVKNDFPLANITIPPGHDNDKCFEPDVESDMGKFNLGYRIEIANFKTAEGLVLAQANSNFSASSSVDFSPPKISFDYRTICVNTNNTLTAWIKDDWGVLEAGFYVDGEFIGTSSPASITRNFTASVVTNKITGGTDHIVKVVALDIALNMSEESYTVKAWPDHCCNSVKDSDETDIDCGGSCPACEGAACAADMATPSCGSNDNCQDYLCKSYFCSCEAEGATPGNCKNAGYADALTECCICRNRPIIDWITPKGGFCIFDINRACSSFADCTGLFTVDCDTETPNGATGNFVTIGGRYFGTYDPAISKVYFDSVEAKLANDPTDGNPVCGNNVWLNNEIIAIVPNGISANPVIKVHAKNGYEDLTNDSIGAPIIFEKNTIQRPGVCQLTPNSGKMNTIVTYDGIKLTTGTAMFGDPASNVAAFNSDFPDSKQGTAKVSNIKTGQTTSYVIVEKVYSNSKYFTKLSDEVAGPSINSFDPEEGNIGQYVTILGSGFGVSKGSNHVYFGPNKSKEASYEFPIVCANSYWRDNQIIVKVPEGIANGDYPITIDLGSRGVIDTAELSPDKFKVNISLPLKPSLCKILPTMGPPSVQIKLWGEYFGDQNADSKVRFYYGKDVSGADIKFWNLDTSVTTGIKPYKIDTNIHIQALTGPVKVVKGSAGLVGNGMNFTVGTCKINDDCGIGGFCCPAGSPASGRCMTKLEECYPEIRSSVYEMNFDTGGVIRCDASPDPGCQKDNTMCSPGTGCNMDCICTNYCDGNLLNNTPLPTCDALDTMCDATKNERCNPNDNCLCDVSCDGVIATASCDPNNALCLSTFNPYCDPDTCFCAPDQSDSCMGFNSNMCASELCPNSPGNCSVGSTTPLKITCDCDKIYPAKNLVYNPTEDRCEKTTMSCSVDEDATAYIGLTPYSLAGYNATCNYVSRLNNEYWQLNPGGASCPNSNWFMETDGWCTLGQASPLLQFAECDKCANEIGLTYDCASEGAADNNGICLANKDVCPDNYACDGSKNCTAVEKDSCECCCRIAKADQDCCVPLKCEGNCGSDALTDTDTYGFCTGCSTDLNADGKVTTAAEKAASDEKCNCSHTSGKYCDYEAAGGKGICRDCQQLVTGTLCSEHLATCCVDGVNEKCRGGEGDTSIVDYDDPYPNLAYCQYYKCTADHKACDSNLVASSTIDNLDIFKTQKDCTDRCGGIPGGNSCFNDLTNKCDLRCSNPYLCLGSVGCYDSTSTPPFFYKPPAPLSSCTAGDGSCRCCCDPSLAGTPDDTCKILDTGKLFCKPDVEPCKATVPAEANKRGLCCGCTADADCVVPPTIPYFDGCGIDTCCRARPMVGKTIPADDATSICRNPLIIAEFDQPMDTPSFTGNVLLVGDFESGICPPDTKYLADLYLPENYFTEGNIFKRFYRKALSYAKKIARPVAYFAKALTAPTAGYNYCAISASITGHNDPRYGGKGVLYVSPLNVLEADTLYYVIIKGDENLDSKSGVLSKYKIGMNGNMGTLTFSGIAYPNAYVWSFRTKPETAPDEGICRLNSITIDPSSYLYQTVQNSSIAGDDIDMDSLYDSERDSDKVFWVTPWSLDKQPIARTLVYSWAWDWWSENTRIAQVVNPIDDSDHQNLRAQNVKEGDTYFDVQSTIIVDTVMATSTVGETKFDQAHVYIMLCENPWPAIKPDWSWEPWCDTKFNCLPLTGDCYNNNFCISYCRDSGGAGTKDDLPAILADGTIVRGSSTIQNILKEYYFFREATPDIAGVGLKVINNATTALGNRVGLQWGGIVIPPDEIFKEFIVYYGTASGTYTESVITSASPYIVNNLENGTKYYFAVTAKYKSGAESGFSGQVEATPQDTTPPGAPKNVTFKVSADKLTISVKWSANTDDTDSYKVYYGLSSGVYGKGENVGNNNEVDIEVATSTNTYYIAVTAIDKNKNESGYSTEIIVTPSLAIAPSIKNNLALAREKIKQYFTRKSP